MPENSLADLSPSAVNRSTNSRILIFNRVCTKQMMMEYLYHPEVQVPKCASTTVEGILKKLSKRNNFTFHRSTNYWRFLSNSLCSWLYPYHPAIHRSKIVLRIWVLNFFNCHIKILRTGYLFQPGVAVQRGGAACEELGQDGERGTDHL